MKKAFSLIAIAAVFSLAACDNKTTETSKTNVSTTTVDPANTIDPDEAILQTDTTLTHSEPTSTPAGTTTGR